MKLKNLVLLALLVVVLGGFLVYKMYNKPHVNVEETKATISLNVSKIINDFSSDEVKANKKYLEKIIEVEGNVIEVKVEKDKTIIALGNPENMENVMCHMVSSKATYEKLKIGDKVTVKGICTGYLLDVILIKCVIIK